jgi:hypothetical protein
MIDRRVLQTGPLAWAAVGYAIALTALPRVNPDASLTWWSSVVGHGED